MKTDPKNSKHIIADEGKSLYRKSNGSGPFKEVLLGLHKSNFIIRNETISDFEEVADNDENNEQN